jgi:hypothetical protein
LVSAPVESCSIIKHNHSAFGARWFHFSIQIRFFIEDVGSYYLAVHLGHCEGTASEKDFPDSIWAPLNDQYLI